MWLNLQIFGFKALWSPYFLIYILIIGLLYYLITGPLRHKFGGTDLPSRKQKIYFYSALLLLYIVKGSPVDLMTHITLTAHMIQMAIYLFVFPIFIIKGIPKWIWKKIAYAPVLGPVIHFLTKPIISLLLFNALFSLYHIPVIFNFSKSMPIAHTSISIILLMVSFIVILPIVSPIKEFDKLKPLLKIAYILASSLLITPACALIIFADVPLYAAYTENGAWLQALSLCVPNDVLQGLSNTLSGPEMFTSMGILIDQQLGGIIMKIMQEITYGAIYCSIIFKWFKVDDINKIDPLPEKTSY
ncbi:cytochrome c oxidase assembly factor CtaG [Oceanobacillus bengalensis]|uniref:Cytochrome c oxidase assembly factor CtaG n=1 Tax=Oceanobacillus bengalensis TaxID=1435466 RepID=A0A494Z6U9_9BACI|nr:cytochrome c oxidase assembly factor CtaG [Oceanobacillus bengalensis]RKQ18302.1 cytochrome c oxidase assembly factor CtaG [Oceanobacillus bengalensis]